MSTTTKFTPGELIDLQARIEALREQGDDYLILAVGTCAADYDVDDGFAVATVRMGNDEATSRAKYLPDAIALARGKIIDERAARKKKTDKAAAALAKVEAPRG